MATIAELNKLFAVENHAKIVSGKGRLPTVKVKNQAAEATISFLGAQLISFIPNGFTETIWLSKASKFVDGNPIRGGIPICCSLVRQKPGRPKPPNAWVRQAYSGISKTFRRSTTRPRWSYSFLNLTKNHANFGTTTSRSGLFHHLGYPRSRTRYNKQGLEAFHDLARYPYLLQSR